MAEDLGYAGREANAEIVVQVVWTQRAVADLQAIRAYIEQFSPLAAQRIALRLLNAGNALDEQPSRGRPVSAGRRELATIAPYLIRYRVKGETVEILAIRHGARKPPA